MLDHDASMHPQLNYLNKPSAMSLYQSPAHPKAERTGMCSQGFQVRPA
jgi:hypothetical protein